MCDLPAPLSARTPTDWALFYTQQTATDVQHKVPLSSANQRRNPQRRTWLGTTTLRPSCSYVRGGAGGSPQESDGQRGSACSWMLSSSFCTWGLVLWLSSCIALAVILCGAELPTVPRFGWPSFVILHLARCDDLYTFYCLKKESGFTLWRFPTCHMNGHRCTYGICKEKGPLHHL